MQKVASWIQDIKGQKYTQTFAKLLLLFNENGKLALLM